jgi:glycosyltransferase involved in cell wall biosynthesis
MLPRSLRKCDGILTVSETSKQVIAEVYGVSEEKIHVVPNAVSIPAIHENSLAEMPMQGDAFLLMVGASWKHKNALELFENHALWKDSYRLKIVAGRGQHSEKLRCRAQELGIQSDVDFIHGVGDAGISELYAGCSALVYPSTIEGFGLPPLEAMAYGKPVIVSDIPVFRELMGEIPFFVRLGDPASWAKAFCDIRDVMADPNHWRIRDGRKLANSYSIDRMQTCLASALTAIWKI